MFVVDVDVAVGWLLMCCAWVRLAVRCCCCVLLFVAACSYVFTAAGVNSCCGCCRYCLMLFAV